MTTWVTEPEAFDSDSVEVTGDAYRHLFRARRLAVGEQVRVVDGLGHARWARISEVGRRGARLALGEVAPANEPGRELVLLTAVPRPERASWLVEKATELGVRAIRFLATERTPRECRPEQLARWHRVASAAVEQCHRARVPEVSGAHAWGELADLLAPYEHRACLDPSGERFGRQTTGTEAAAVLVGPEGGWSRRELDALAGLHARFVSLGPSILRVETAALAATALWLANEPG